MKHLLALMLAMLLSLPGAAFAQEEPTVRYVYDLYQYCVDVVDSESEQRDAELLACINEDLEYYQYRTFESLDDVLAFIEGYMPEDDEEGEQDNGQEYEF